MFGSPTLVRVLRFALAAFALLAAGPTTAQAANGTIRALKGGDRKVGETSNRAYALPLAGATFEYTTSDGKAKDPASAGWTAFPSATDAGGAATVSVAPGTYYVRERTMPAGFASFGPVKSLFYDPGSGIPSTARPYVAKVVVESGQVTEAYPNRNPGGDTAAWSSTSGGDSGSPFVNVRDNQAFPSSCGINVLLVLDRSGSIAPFKGAYRDAAKAFVSALDGTPTQVGILSFSAGDAGVSSYQDGSGGASFTHAPLDLSAAGSAAALQGTIDSVYASPSGGTNWDRALQKASQAKGFASNAATGQTGNPDVVVFITDGNPTARSTDGSDAGSNVDLLDLTAGMSSADLVKSQPARGLTKLKLYALGVGSGVTPGNLAAVSGPALGEDYETPTVAQLTTTLTELAARSCGARIYVRKRLTGNGADQADWGFSATGNGGSIGYLDGNPRTHATAGGTIETGVVLTQLPAAGREVTITEDGAGQPLSEFALDGVACRSGGYDGAPVTPVATAALGVKIAVRPGSAIYCTFTNSPKRPKLTISKTPDSKTIDAGDDAEFAIVVANAGTGTAGNVALSDALPAQGSWSISADPGGCSIASGVLTCKYGDLAAGASRTVKVKTATSRQQCSTYVNGAAVASSTESTKRDDGNVITCVEPHLTPGIELDKTVRLLGSGAFVDAGLQAHVGDTLEYRLAVTTGSGDAPIADVQLSDPRCDPGTLSGPSISGGDHNDLLDPGETWTYTCTHVVGEQDPNPLPNTARVTGRDNLGAAVCDEDSTSVAILKPSALIVKEGNAFAYPGDTVAFTFSVLNNGNAALSGVTVTDDRCAPVTGPVQKLQGDQDDLLEPGEQWIFTCSKQIPAGHRIGDENPIRNVATASGRDQLGKVVESTDDHLVRILHPAIEIEKTGPATARAGTPLPYRLTVTNPGDVPFAAETVGVADPKCEQPPAGPDTAGDATPGQLDPGDRWTYTCTAPTAGRPAGYFVNTAMVTARDFNGREVSDTDDFTTALETQGVLPKRITPGSSRLSGPSGCVRKPFEVVVRGKRIARVTFFRDGRRIKTVKAAPGQRTFTLSIAPSQEPGVHRVTARVVFAAGSGTRARTLRLSYQRCVRRIVRPRFTG